jgi:3-deoxy-D-manno-octulosonic-acid transferase
LRERYPEHPVLITTTTPTGSARIREVLGDEVMHVYAPYDLPGAVARFLDQIQPVMAIIMETEIWPNIFHHCAQRKIPTVLANARMSARSATGYRKLGKFMQGVMGTIDVVAAQSQDDAARLIGLGVKPDHMHVIGSVKFDVHIPASLKEQAAVLRRDWGVDRSIWIAASTRQGEEETILDAYAHVKHAQPDALLVLVPRHPERFDGVASLCEKRGFNLVRRSEHRGCDSDTDIYLGDSMGELSLFYAASDIAFIGGTLVDAGGQNPIEAAALGLPIIIGPSFYNFTDIGRMLRESEAVCEVKDSEQLAASVVDCFRDPNLRHQRGENARGVVERNRGALEKLLKLIDDLGMKRY